MASIDIPIVLNFDMGQVEELIKKQLAENDYVEVPQDNADDINLAIIGLGIFRKAFCLNVKETENEIEPVFRCPDCLFEDKASRKCSVKMFLSKYATEEDRHRFLPIV